MQCPVPLHSIELCAACLSRQLRGSLSLALVTLIFRKGMLVCLVDVALGLTRHAKQAKHVPSQKGRWAPLRCHTNMHVLMTVHWSQVQASRKGVANPT